MWLNLIYAVYWWCDEYCNSYGCEKLTTHCAMQRAALGSPNIQRPCSNSSEAQTCFVSSAVFANLFESTGLISFNWKTLKPMACTALVNLEDKPRAWTDPNLKPGRFSLSNVIKTNKWITMFPWCILFFWQIRCMNALLLRLWVYGSIGW